ncbi:hypothetical protein PENTCL1PPCAC_17143 [Pristionchus entomophagus]|uniref:NTR domain-containing protein n=1 Tax=Pristionchus entomophagus TaxID=358040 RepID=A0AAV5TL86_9BILA|nr:hypothetical protein PENTCL1PPCAC_17143 [Pristionchus entomophagus]
MRSSILLALVVVYVSFACKCAQRPAKEAFCSADWVSRARIAQSVTVQIDGGFDGTQFGVEHVEIFSSPNNETFLPQIVHTASSSAACGLALDVGEEYLLSGSMTNETLHVTSCGQIKPEGLAKEVTRIVIEWSNVPNDFPEKMKKFECEPKDE